MDHKNYVIDVVATEENVRESHYNLGCASLGISS
jgi:hypothetical protein